MKNEVYKIAFGIAQEGHSVLLFAFESTENVVREFLISEYTKTPFELLRIDSKLAEKKRAEFLNMIDDPERGFSVISEVKLSNKEIEEHITRYKETNPLTHVVFDKEIELDFVFRLQMKYSIKVITSSFYTESL